MIEILAPAGDLISLKSAIASDTNAVYLGLSAFNARIKAENFTTENIKDTVDYCHLFDVKVYVTINIAVKESEKEELKSIIVACGQANVDAFIITDMLALELAKKFAPKVRLHASTQFGVRREICRKSGVFTRSFVARGDNRRNQKNQSRNKLGNRVFRARCAVRCVFREMSYVVVH